MRFKNHIHIVGNKRTRKAFLLFPKRINNETRWLEVAKWIQEERHNFYNGVWYWVNLFWVDDQEAKDE